MSSLTGTSFPVVYPRLPYLPADSSTSLGYHDAEVPTARWTGREPITSTPSVESRGAPNMHTC